MIQNKYQPYRVISAANDDAFSGALYSVGGEESQVLGLKGVLVGELRAAGLGLRLAGQTGVVYFEAAGLDDTDISGNSIAEFNLQLHYCLIST